MDEAGRGALAGPLVVAAVVVRDSFKFGNVAPDVMFKDSKLLSQQQRLKAFEIIEAYSISTCFEVLSVEEINENGINWANIEGFRRLIDKVYADKYVIDGCLKVSDIGLKTSATECMIRADETIPAVMAAGIVAKVNRDEIMQKLHYVHPEFRWITNTGHGTPQHINAIKEHGLCRHHRLQFVRTALKDY